MASPGQGRSKDSMTGGEVLRVLGGLVLMYLAGVLIYRSVDGETIVDPYATSLTTTYTDRNLPNDFDRIEYYVSAENACGEGPRAGPVVVRPKGPPR